MINQRINTGGPKKISALRRLGKPVTSDSPSTEQVASPPASGGPTNLTVTLQNKPGAGTGVQNRPQQSIRNTGMGNNKNSSVEIINPPSEQVKKPSAPIKPMSPATPRIKPIPKIVNTSLAGADKGNQNQLRPNAVNAREKVQPPPQLKPEQKLPTPVANSAGPGASGFRKRKFPSNTPMGQHMRQMPMAFADKAPLPGGKRKLFIMGWPKEGVTKEDLKELFTAYGVVEDIFCNLEKCFGFVTMDTKENAENARKTLDRTDYKGRMLFVRVANQILLKVENLDPSVTNELLREVFEHFGDLERACVACDSNGRSLGYALVEFTQKRRAEMAMARINEQPFFLTKSTKPVTVKAMPECDEEVGLSENIIKRSAQHMEERSVEARFAQEDTVEHAVGTKWLEQFALEARQRAHLEERIAAQRDTLHVEIEELHRGFYAYQLRKEVEEKQRELERLERYSASGFSQLAAKRALLDRNALARDESQFMVEHESYVPQQQLQQPPEQQPQTEQPRVDARMRLGAPNKQAVMVSSPSEQQLGDNSGIFIEEVAPLDDPFYQPETRTFPKDREDFTVIATSEATPPPLYEAAEEYGGTIGIPIRGPRAINRNEQVVRRQPFGGF